MAQEKMVVDGQSLWMDDYSRAFAHHGILLEYIGEYSVSGLSVNSKTLALTVANSNVYDQVIAKKLREGLYGESLAISLVHDDTQQAADILRPIHDRTDGVDGWATLPASPLAVDNQKTLTDFILKLNSKANRPNILVRLPIIPERISNLEDLVYQGVPLNVTNIYSHSQYLEVAEACLNGMKRRINEQLKPVVPIFINIGICHLQAALTNKISNRDASEVAIAMAKKIYLHMRTLHNSPEWERVYNLGARPLRLAWNCSCGTVGTQSKLSLAHRLRAPFTIITLAEELIAPFAKSRHMDAVMLADMDYDGIIEKHNKQGVNVKSVAEQLQKVAVELLRNQWIMMLETVAKKSAEISHLKTDTK